MRILLLAIALLATAGSAAATNDHQYIQFDHGVTGPGTNPYGCQGEPPAGCYDAYGFASYQLIASDDPNNVYAIVCSIQGQPNSPPGPGVNVGAQQHNDTSNAGPSANVGACLNVWDDSAGIFVNGGEGVNNGQSWTGFGYNGNGYVQPGEFVHAQFNQGGGNGNSGANSWAQADVNDFQKCVGAGVGTNNGGINVGTFCF